MSKRKWSIFSFQTFLHSSECLDSHRVSPGFNCFKKQNIQKCLHVNVNQLVHTFSLWFFLVVRHSKATPYFVYSVNKHCMEVDFNFLNNLNVFLAFKINFPNLIMHRFCAQINSSAYLESENLINERRCHIGQKQLLEDS